MGGMMSMLLAEHGIDVHFFDPSNKSVDALLSHAREAKLQDRIIFHENHESLCKAMTTPRVFIFSIPHGKAGDDTIDGLEPFLSKGDILMDASNEHWKNTERRQQRLEPHGIQFIGMGVSGGYQSARHGPSFSPGGNPEALKQVFPFLQKIAAKDKHGRPCVAKLSPGGCGHYVKMVHNGIEQGLMTALCEAWGIMNRGLGMSYEEIADVFEQWNKEGQLQDNFLVDIGREICRTKDPNTGTYVLANVRDKVVQDADGTEGTGVWTCEEAVRLHVPAPTIAAAHLFRLASADAARRLIVERSVGTDMKPRQINTDKTKLLAALHQATYAAFLASFIQGLHVLARSNDEHGWNLDFADVLQLWRGGCIIRSDYIVDLLESVYRSREHDNNDLLGHSRIGKEFAATFQSLKEVVIRAMEVDLNVPALSASLEYIKYSAATDLPTSFMEAELDYFGEHMFDLKSAEPGKPITGKHHFEWHPARGIFEEMKV
jgi:6-phosphogluconate dehydrogenase